MDAIVLTVYYNGHWELEDGAWQFNGVHESKTIILKLDTSYEDLVRIIVERFKVDTSSFDMKLTHMNVSHPSLNPCDVNCNEDIEAFFGISKMPNVMWKIPICVVITRKGQGADCDTFVAESPCNSIGVTPRESPMEKQDKRSATEKELMVVSDHEVLPTLPDGFLQKGQCFKSKEDLKTAICLHAMAKCFEFRVLKSAHSLVLVVCIDKKCGWRVRAMKLKNSDMFFISKFINTHTCAFDSRRSHQRQASYQLIAKRIGKMFNGVSKGPTPGQITAVIRNEYGFRASYWKCWKAKGAATDRARGTAEESYTTLDSYFYMLEKVNPGTMATIEVDDNDCLKSAFLAFGQSIRGYPMMRKVISVDGTFLKGRFGGVLLVAAAQDGNIGIYPVAFAIVDAETDASWEFFMRNLKAFVPDCDEQVFISDRNPSIKKGILANYKLAKHGICIYHLKQDLKTKCRVKKIQEMFMMAAESYKQPECIQIYDQISRENVEIAMYLQEADIHSWARSFFPGKRYNVMTSNNAETINSVLEDPRGYPVQALFDEIRITLCKWFVERREIGQKNKQWATPNVQKIIRSKLEKAMTYNCRTLNASSLEFEVTGGEVDVIVNLSSRTCSCKAFDLDDIPCTHALTAAIQMDINVESLVGEYFTNSCYLKGYEETIYPVPDKSDWDVPQEVRDIVCHPPKRRRRSGRPKKKRIPSAVEHGRKREKCSMCGKLGHNKKTCGLPP